MSGYEIVISADRQMARTEKNGQIVNTAAISRFVNLPNGKTGIMAEGNESSGKVLELPLLQADLPWLAGDGEIRINAGEVKRLLCTFAPSMPFVALSATEV